MNYEEHLIDIDLGEQMRLQHEAELLATYDLGFEGYAEIIQTGLLPKYVKVGGVVHRRTVNTGDELTHAEFLALPSDSMSRRNAGHDGRDWLFGLIHGRVGVYRTSGRLPLLGVEEIIDAIGVDRPTPAQVDFATGILSTLFGEPKRFDGKNRWRVALSFDDQTLAPWLHEQFPLPAFDWAAPRVCSQHQPGVTLPTSSGIFPGESTVEGARGVQQHTAAS